MAEAESIAELVPPNEVGAVDSAVSGPPVAEAGGVLTIDLGAIEANWRSLRRHVTPAECAAVIKADGYGCGIEKVVVALARAGCRTFFVADLAEARRVRAVVSEPAIYVLNGLMPGTASQFAGIRVRPVISSMVELAEWDAFVSNNQWRGGAALHVDTGMNRLGVTVNEAAALARGIPSSLANSSGIFLGSTAHCDMVRPGVAIYGVNPIPGQINPMRPVIELRAHILQVRTVPRGETVGYGASWTAKRTTRIAVLAVGYADGYLRAASATDEAPGGNAIVAGMRCPLAGRISMDLLAIDITELPDGAAHRGDFATLIGDQITVDAVASAAGTIGYEVLTSLGRRYHRVYRG